MEENQVEQTAETQEEAPQVQEQPTNTFTQDEVNNIVERRLAKERGSMYKKLGVEDLDIAVNAVKTQKDLEEKQRIQKGEFEEILKTRTQEFNKEKSNLENQLKDIKINKSLLSSASRNKAINPDQVVELLKSDIKLNESGNVEILDKSGLARYNKMGELLSTDELVQEFLTQNPHFVSATPSGSGSVSNVDRSELNKPLNLSDLDMNNPTDRKKYSEYRKIRDSKPSTIVLNN
ncbi:phage protein GP20 [uncultured Mediterranean phage uvMED]|nr:phage protein GP20 [uncultured Mediterranean phage uvMED]BAQ91798.1 phage protein GP20 [uncultured Mediterranean phage uvMED]BAR20546.1 phage protein GP20 [uncultured Mediterranean phage uvMED]